MGACSDRIKLTLGKFLYLPSKLNRTENPFRKKKSTEGEENGL